MQSKSVEEDILDISNQKIPSLRAGMIVFEKREDLKVISLEQRNCLSSA